MTVRHKLRLSFQHRVFLALLALCWALVGAFLIFQYKREKTFRTELLDMELQIHNARILEDLRRGEDISDVISRLGPPLPDLRMTIIDKAGTVIYDNNDKTPFPTTNHNNRPEIIEARKYGVGNSVRRHSLSDNTNYFYSATLAPDGNVIRSAAPYGHSLQDVLKADRTFLWIMLGITIAVSFAGYFVSRKLSTSIIRLNAFAESAEKGERIPDAGSFPDDELGNIASNIVRLYVQRDERHREALQQEREKISLKKQLTNNINHELKTPVASIRICSELLLDHPEMEAERRREFIERIFANTTRLESLLKDVASLTRMDDGAAQIAMSPVNVRKLIEELAASERGLTDMSITTDVADITVNGNRSLLESLFRNLIDNAVAYSGGTQITIRGTSDGKFTVSDNGTGIADEHLAHIFERFYRIDKGRSRERGGTGLGLAIVKNAVGIHGGTITASNDGGLRFDFTLKPIAQS